MIKNKILVILLLCANCFNPLPLEGTSIETENSTSGSNLTETDPWNGTFGTTFITLTSTNVDVTTENNLTISDLPENSTENLESTGLSESTEELIETSTGEEFNSSTSVSEPVCGDGILDDNEQCDDGNRLDEDDCSGECYKSRIVFLTNEFIGVNNFGGIEEADEFCQIEAIQFNIIGTFKAWISDDNPNNDPFVRFNSIDFKGWYKLPSVDGEPNSLLAKGWGGLISPLLNPVNITSAGVKDLSTVRVWTATKPNGKRVINVSTCSNWQSLADNQTIVGNPQVITDHWTDGSGAQCSGMSGGGKLYCFQID